MQEFWNQVFLDNTLREYGIVLAVILAAWLFRKFLGRYVSAAVFRLLRNFGRSVERDDFLNLIVGPVQDFLFLLISYLALRSLKFPEVLKARFFKMTTPDIVEGIAEVVLIWYFVKMLLRLVDYMSLVMSRKADLTPSQDDNQLIVFFKDFVKVILIIIGFLLLLKLVFMQDISKVLAGLSIVGAAIALAARESLENMIASFIIFFDKPFTSGDLLKVHNITGTVERIGLRSTRIRTVDKTYVTVPNKQMVDSIVDNLTHRTHRRGEIKVTVDASTSSSQIEKLITAIKDMLKSQGLVEYNVQFTEIVNDGFVVHFDYLSTVMDYKQFLLQKDQINLSMMRLLEDLGIELAGKHSVVGIVQK